MPGTWPGWLPMYKLIIEFAAFLAATFRESAKLVDFELRRGRVSTQ